MDLGGGRWVSVSLLLLCNNSRLTPLLNPSSLPSWEFPNKPDDHIKIHSTILELAEKYGGTNWAVLITSSYPATVTRTDSAAVSIASMLDQLRIAMSGFLQLHFLFHKALSAGTKNNNQSLSLSHDAERLGDWVVGTAGLTRFHIT